MGFPNDRHKCNINTNIPPPESQPERNAARKRDRDHKQRRTNMLQMHASLRQQTRPKWTFVQSVKRDYLLHRESTRACNLPRKTRSIASQVARLISVLTCRPTHVLRGEDQRLTS